MNRDRKLIELVIRELIYYYDDNEVIDYLERLMNSSEYAQFLKDNPLPELQSDFTSCDRCGCHPAVIYQTEIGRFCQQCKPSNRI